MKMTDLRKAAEMALERLESHEYWMDEEAIQALRQALAQPEQEPVGYVTIETISSWAKVPSIKWFKKPTQGPLYTAPPKREWVGLTNEDFYGQSELQVITMKYAEAKLKKKNGK